MEWVDQARADAQEQMAEPIVAVGFLQPAGSWGSFGMSKLSGAAGTLAQSKANRRAKGLAKGGGFKPKLAMLAATADGISVFSASPARGGKVKVGELIMAWRRDDLTITTRPGRLATGVTIDVASTGDRFELEATMIGGGFNDALLAEIAPPS